MARNRFHTVKSTVFCLLLLLLAACIVVVAIVTKQKAHHMPNERIPRDDLCDLVLLHRQSFPYIFFCFVWLDMNRNYCGHLPVLSGLRLLARIALPVRFVGVVVVQVPDNRSILLSNETKPPASHSMMNCCSFFSLAAWRGSADTHRWSIMS